jgi:hypothetical protein
LYCWEPHLASDYFSKAFSLHNEHPGDAVLQFAIACLHSVNIDRANWPMFQKILFLCVIPDPACHLIQKSLATEIAVRSDIHRE